MDSANHQSIPAWASATQLPSYGQLHTSCQAEVCVIGTGVAGLTTAYLLACAGRSVVVLSDGPLGSGESARTTAHLSHALDDLYVHLEKLHGAEGARLAAESHSAAIDEMERIVRTEQIDCGFERLDGYLFLSPGTPRDLLRREMAAAHRAGLSNVHLVDQAPLPSWNSGPALCFPRQAQVHPLRYLRGLSAAIEARGGRIYTQTHVCRVRGGRPAHVVTTDGASVTSDAVVVATNTPINDMVVMHTKQAAYRTYVIGATVPAGSVPRALYWDTANRPHGAYHYVRVLTDWRAAGAAPQPAQAGPQPDQNEDLLIIGGEDHKTGQAKDGDARYERLEAWARMRFPIRSVECRWSGQIMETIDGLAFIGANPLDASGIYIAAGDSGHGMTHGTIAGLLITDLIFGRHNPWARLYHPARKTLGAAWDYARENLNVAAQYTHYLRGGDATSEADVRPGEGAILQRGLRKIAVYRDEAGVLHEFSAVCPHLAGIVAWNPAEKSWDCPCHGSRFDVTGRVLNGPAISGLSPVGPEHPLPATARTQVAGTSSAAPTSREAPGDSST